MFVMKCTMWQRRPQTIEILSSKNGKAFHQITAVGLISSHMITVFLKEGVIFYQYFIMIYSFPKTLQAFKAHQRDKMLLSMPITLLLFFLFCVERFNECIKEWLSPQWLILSLHMEFIKYIQLFSVCVFKLIIPCFGITGINFKYFLSRFHGALQYFWLDSIE